MPWFLMRWRNASQSLNIYIASVSGKKLDETYKLAWVRGLKTTYYLRSLGATSAEKSTVQAGSLNAVPAEGSLPAMGATAVPATDVSFCSVDDPECESCQ